MESEHFRDGTVVIRFNSQGEKLEAPSEPGEGRRHWLPCSGFCQQLQNVGWNVVAITCPPCQQEEDE